MSRLPIRARLAATFAIVMALVLTATGFFLYSRLGSDLDLQLDRELTARLAGTVAIVRDDGDDLGDPRNDPLQSIDDVGFVQVLEGRDGTVAGASTADLAGQPLVDEAGLRQLLTGEAVSQDVFVPAIGETIRIKAAEARDDGVPYSVIVGASLEQHDATLQSLRTLLLIGGAGALLLASLAGYGVATGALRPVESMRRRAALISASAPGRRLPVGRAGDEIASLGTTLNQMLERLEAAYDRERRFVSDASHELRTPLAILKAELALALKDGRSRADLEAALRSATDETDRLVQLAEDLLVIARAEDGRLPVSLAEIDVRELVGSLRDRFARRAADAGRDIQVKATADARVVADVLRLEQALSNMVDNALSHGDGTITVEARRENAWLELHVVDEGPGFPPEFLADAFERFTRADSGRARGGAGLGLAIVEVIARAHRGSAHAANAAGGGADVWLSLPVVEREEGATGAPDDSHASRVTIGGSAS